MWKCEVEKAIVYRFKKLMITFRWTSSQVALKIITEMIIYITFNLNPFIMFLFWKQS